MVFPFSFWLTRLYYLVTTRKHIAIFKFVEKFFDYFKNSYVHKRTHVG
nr:MAG TPA: hypothetical protein [Caudoviricetes sp.]